MGRRIGDIDRSQELFDRDSSPITFDPAATLTPEDEVLTTTLKRIKRRFRRLRKASISEDNCFLMFIG
jgi:hypothetical protein